ncbi:Holliday junction branch migration protein RuvA [soil metagenome]
MIAYIKGKLTVKTPVYIIVESSGIGYQVFISLNTYSQLQDKDEALVHTYLHITETAHTLYGFADELEKQVFTHLISVSGVGPATARLALSSMAPGEVQRAIIQGNVVQLQKIKGVGAKSAQRIILELKDKMIKTADGPEIISASRSNTNREEALSALVALGFQRNQAEKAIDKVLAAEDKEAPVETIIKLALKAL